MAETHREMFVRVLTDTFSYKIIPHISKKYIVCRARDGSHFMYIGKSGAVRRGKTVSTSTPVSGAYKRKLLAIARGEIQP